MMSVAPAWCNDSAQPQERKAPSPIEVTELPIWTVVRPLQE